MNITVMNECIVYWFCFSCRPTSSVSRTSTPRSTPTLCWGCTRPRGPRTRETSPSLPAASTNSSSILHGTWWSVISIYYLSSGRLCIFVCIVLCIFRWINRKDLEGRNIFTGGFLGLDNIGIFDRSKPLPTGMDILKLTRGIQEISVY